jgi:hypothetical protein
MLPARADQRGGQSRQLPPALGVPGQGRVGRDYRAREGSPDGQVVHRPRRARREDAVDGLRVGVLEAEAVPDDIEL